MNRIKLAFWKMFRMMMVHPFWALLTVTSVGAGLAIGNSSDAVYGVGAGLVIFGTVGMIFSPILNDPWL